MCDRVQAVPLRVCAGKEILLKNSIGWMLLLQLVLILLNAVFACAEIAVLSANALRVEKLGAEGSKKARRLGRLMAQPEKFLATIQVAITLSGFLGSAFAAENFSGRLADWLIGLGVGASRGTLEAIAVVVITLILSYFTLIFGELVPKRIAMKNAEAVALGVSGVITAISRLFAPIVWLLSVSTNAVLRLLGVDPGEINETPGEADIRMMVEASGEQGGIDREEQTFIQNVFEFDDLTAGEIATHRTEVDLLWLDEPMDTWEATIHGTRHTRYPVCEDSPDKVIGILDARDYFRLNDKSRESVLAAAVKPAYFVPESVKADVLFRNMRSGRSGMAVVLDEYGGMVGIVTLNDLIGQLVGAFDEGAGNEPAIRKRADGSLETAGNAALDDIERALGVDLGVREHDTLTGLVFDALGMIPEDGPQDIRLDAAGLRIHIREVRGHQIARAELRKQPDAGTEAGEE